MELVSPVKVATFVIGAMLSARFLFGNVDLAIAGPTAASSQTITLKQPAEQLATKPRGRAYLFRGALGPIFSRGMDRLTERIEHAGIEANVYEFTVCSFVAERAIQEYRKDPAPVILIGHSMGGFCALKFAEMFQVEDIPVSLVVTFDPAHVSPNVPLNVERYINIFLSKNILGGGDVMPKKGYQGHYASFDLTEHEEISHINIDKLDSLHEQLVAKIVQLATTTTNAEGKAVPLRYVVPSKAAIELWDSGKQVFARSGDTPQSIAEFYHVPLWSLAQVNRTSNDAPLVPGQPVIVPHHLVPSAEVFGQSPSKR